MPVCLLCSHSVSVSAVRLIVYNSNYFIVIMPSCVVPTCKNSAGRIKKKDGITFHTFPGDEKRKAQWTKIIRRTRPEHWELTKGSLICSVHFDEKYFYDTKCGLKRLRKEAFPNKNLVMAAEEPEGYIEISKPETSKEVTMPKSPSQSESLIGDVNVSDSDSMFDSPTKVKLKSQLRHKELLCQKYIRTIRALNRKNNRLVKKNESLKTALRTLRKNRYINDYVHSA